MGFKRSQSKTQGTLPEADRKGLRPTTPPLTNTRLSRLIYILILLTGVLGAYYSYRLVQYKTEVGGWFSLAIGRKPPSANRGPVHHKTHPRDSVEDKINDLALALGMPPKELASAIAVAVRNYVPPASLSSVAARETGPAVEEMLKEPSDEDPPCVHDERKSGSSTGVVEEVVNGFEKFVGMDEP